MSFLLVPPNACAGLCGACVFDGGLPRRSVCVLKILRRYSRGTRCCLPFVSFLRSSSQASKSTDADLPTMDEKDPLVQSMICHLFLHLTVAVLISLLCGGAVRRRKQLGQV